MREQVRTLVDRGARAFVVSLLWSFVNPAHEKAVKRIIREEYRDYHVGYLPVILCSRGRLAARRVRPLEHRDPRRLPAALDADRALRHVGQAARARLPRAVLHDPQHGRLRRPVQDDRVAHLQRRADRRADRRARHRQAARRAQRRHRRRRRHVVRHRARRAATRVRNYEFNPIIDQWMVSTTMLQSLSIGAGGGSIASINERARRPARGRPAERRLLPGPGRLPARRHRADGHRRQPRARLPQPGRSSSPAAWRSTSEAAEEAIRRRIAEPLGAVRRSRRPR